MTKSQDTISSHSKYTGTIVNPLFFYDDLQTVSALGIATGTTNLYTAPAGKRVMICGATVANLSGVGNITYSFSVSVSGTSYQLRTAQTLTNGSQASNITGVYILEPGEIFQITTGTNNGLNVWCRIMTFPSSFPLYSPKIIAPSSGDNTIYTCPAGAKAIPIHGSQPYLASVGFIGFGNSSGGALNLTSYVVPSGGAVGTTNKSNPATSVGNGVTSYLQINSILSAGDFIVGNLSGTGTASILWTSVYEIYQ